MLLVGLLWREVSGSAKGAERERTVRQRSCRVCISRLGVVVCKKLQETLAALTLAGRQVGTLPDVVGLSCITLSYTELYCTTCLGFFNPGRLIEP